VPINDFFIGVPRLSGVANGGESKIKEEAYHEKTTHVVKVPYFRGGREKANRPLGMLKWRESRWDYSEEDGNEGGGRGQKKLGPILCGR